MGKEPLELVRQLIFQDAFEPESTPKPKSVSIQVNFLSDHKCLLNIYVHCSEGHLAT